MLLGCHLSIADGLAKTIDKAEALGINALQIFSHSARSWRIDSLKEDEAERFRRRKENSRVKYAVIHTGYLLNLASPKDDLYEKSIQALKEELWRAHLLNIKQVNTHIGAHTGAGLRFGIKRAIEALNEIASSPEAYRAADVKLLLENTAGEGTTIGAKFAELAEIWNNLDSPERFGLCFDTCHGFAAGYDIANEEGLEKTLKLLDKLIGLEHLELIHLNDSKFALGSRKDRHEHIGQGCIGLAGFKAIINHPKLRDLPFILETPKQAGEVNKLNSKADIMNLEQVRKLCLT